MPRPLLIPLDGSPFAESALPIAADLARLRDLPLHLASVHVPPILFAGAAATPAALLQVDGEIRDRETRYLGRVAAQLADRAGTAPITTLLEGSVVQALAGYAAEINAQAIMISSHGWGGATRMFQGNVADGLIRRGTCPVVVVRPGRGAGPRGLAARGRILIPLDGSPRAEAILDHVLALWGSPKVELTLLRVIPADRLDPSRAEEFKQTAIATRYLASVARRLRPLGLAVQPRVAVAEHVARAILDYAVREPVDLIALSTRGRGGVGRLVFGSVADQVVRGATGRLLVWHPPAEARSEVLDDRAAPTAQDASV